MTDTMDVKTRHIKDRKNPERVLTLVTRLTGGKLEYAFALNSPPRFVVENNRFDSSRFEVKRIEGDRFSRKVGRRIALGRLNCPRSVASVNLGEGTHPYISVLTALAADTENHTAARIAHDALRTFYRRYPARVAMCNTDEASGSVAV